MHAFLLASALFVQSATMQASAPPQPPPIRVPEQAIMRPEEFRIDNPGYDKYVRRKKRKQAREAWRQ